MIVRSKGVLIACCEYLPSVRACDENSITFSGSNVGQPADLTLTLTWREMWAIVQQYRMHVERTSKA